MGGITALRKLQMGAETTAGTDVAATSIWRGNGTIEDLSEVTIVDENIGILANTDRAYIAKVGAAINLDATPMTFEQFPYLMEMGHDTESATQDGSGSGYIWQWLMPTTAQPTIKTYTWEGGNNQQAVECAYCFLDNFTLSGAVDEAWQMSASAFGRQVANTTYTADLTVPTVEEALFNKTKLYIDGVTTYPATTAKTDLLIGASLTRTTGMKGQQTGNGELYFSYTKTRRPEMKLELTFEHQTAAETEITAWRNKTPRSIRLLVEGSTFTTAGTTYSKKSVIFDVVGVWESFSGLDDDDGDSVVTGTLNCGYDTTAASAGRVIVVNTLSTLP